MQNYNSNIVPESWYSPISFDHKNESIQGRRVQIKREGDIEKERERGRDGVWQNTTNWKRLLQIK